MTVHEWIKDRIRDDRRDARWHVAALHEIADYLHAHGLAPKTFTVELGVPASTEEVAELAASRTHGLPDSLRTLWSVHRSARWSLGKEGMRLLDPRWVAQRRPRARKAGEVLLEKLPPDAAARSAPLYGALDVLVETNAGEPVTFVADVARDDGRVFSHAAEHPNDFWWEVSLSWMLATRFLAAFEQAIAVAVPEIDKLRYGERKTAAQRPATKSSKQPAKKKPAPAKKKPAPAKKKPLPAKKKPVPAKKPAKAPKKPAKPTPKPKPKAKSKKKR
jgi:hypothetical protein